MLKNLMIVSLAIVFVTGCGGSSGGSKKSSSSSSSSVAATSSSKAATSVAISSAVSSAMLSSSSSAVSVAPSSSSSSNSSAIVVTSSSEMSSSSEASSEVSSSSETSSSEMSSSSEASSAASSSSSSTAPVPVAIYSFEDNLDEASGVLASGMITGNTALNTGGSVAYAGGTVGKSLVLNGTSGVKLANNLITDHSYSISLWLEPTVKTPYTAAFFGWASNNSWVSIVPGGGPASTPNAVYWSGIAWFDGMFGAPIPAASWTHVVVTVNGGLLTTYLNGAATATLPGFPNIFAGGTGEFALGVNLGTLDLPYNGKIDEVKVYNEVLSSNDVTTLYDERLKLPVGLWYGKRGGVVTQGVNEANIAVSSDYDGAGIWRHAPVLPMEGATIEAIVNVDSQFKASGAGLKIQAYVQDGGSYPGKADCAVTDSSSLTPGVDQTVSCVMTQGGVFTQTVSPVEIELVAVGSTVAGSFTLKSSRIVLP